MAVRPQRTRRQYRPEKLLRFIVTLSNFDVGDIGLPLLEDFDNRRAQSAFQAHVLVDTYKASIPLLWQGLKLHYTTFVFRSIDFHDELAIVFGVGS